MTTKQFNFTKKIIEELPKAAEGMREHYQDTRIKALRLEVTDTGKKTYKVYRKKGGRPIRYTIGDIRDWTLENARVKAEEISAQISKGINPNIEKQRIRQEVTFGELFSEYLERHSKKHKRSWRYDEREVNKFLKHWFNRKISSLSRDDMRRLHDKVGRQNGPIQANRILGRIRAIYNKAIEWGWQGSNPAEGIEKFAEKSRDRFLKPSELPFFFEALNEEENETASHYILISLYTGARKSNVLSMRWVEIDFQQSEWRIPETKNGTPLTVALSKEAIDILERQRKKTNRKWVFPSDITEGHLADPRKPWIRILTNATIKLWQAQEHFAPIVKEAMEKTDSHEYDEKLYAAIQALAKEKNRWSFQRGSWTFAFMTSGGRWEVFKRREEPINTSSANPSGIRASKPRLFMPGLILIPCGRLSKRQAPPSATRGKEGTDNPHSADNATALNNRAPAPIR